MHNSTMHQISFLILQPNYIRTRAIILYNIQICTTVIQIDSIHVRHFCILICLHFEKKISGTIVVGLWKVVAVDFNHGTVRRPKLEQFTYDTNRSTIFTYFPNAHNRANTWQIHMSIIYICIINIVIDL